MGSKPAKEEQPPQKTLKELQREFSRTIKRQQREFEREIQKLETNNKKIRSDLEKMVKNKEPKSTMRIIASNIVKNNNYIQKYQRLDAQLSDVTFQINSATTNEVMVNVMKQMATIMKRNNENIDVKNMQRTMMEFNMEMEKNEMMQEQINEIMNQDMDEDENDAQVDNLIAEVEMKVGGGGGGGMINQNQPNKNQQANQMDDFENRLEALK